MQNISFKKYLTCLCIPFLLLLTAKSTPKETEESLVAKLNNTTDKIECYQLINQLVDLNKVTDQKKSILYATQGEILARNSKDTKWLANFQLKSASSHYYLSSYDIALDKYLMATKNYETLNDTLNLIRCLNNTGLVYDRIEKYEKAITYYQYAISCFEELSEQEKKEYAHFLPQHHNNIASAFNKLNQTDKAIEHYNTALNEALKIDFRYILGAIYSNLSIIQIEKKNYANARTHIDKAIKLRLEDKENIGLAKSYNILSQYFLCVENSDSSIWASEKSLKISKQLNLLEIQKSTHFLLYEAYEQNGRYSDALEEHKTYSILNDSINNSEKMNRLTKIEITQEVEKTEKNNNIEMTKLKYQYTILFVLLSSIVIISILIARLYKLQKNKLNIEYSKLELNIDTQNRELTTNAMQLVEKNQQIQDVVKELLKLKDNINEESQKTLHNIITNLQSRTNKEFWQEFEFRFNKVHTNFYVNLTKEHPAITASEKRLCALLRLNMTSKEISTMTNQTTRGVEVARSRLRKRLDLTGKEISIINYLESF